MLNCPPVADIVDLIYPVGSYFITESENLNTVAKVQAHFGGTWVQVTGRFLYGSTSAGATGGEATHTLTVDEMPSHTHLQNKHHHNLLSNNYGNANANGFGNGDGVRGVSGVWTNGNQTNRYYEKDNNNRENQLVSDTTPTNQNTGGGQAHNNMPPYREVYMYRRTA